MSGWTFEVTAEMVTEEISAAVELAYQEKRSLIAGLSEADLARRTTNPQWGVRQIAAHLAQEDDATIFIGKRLAIGKNATPPAIVVNLANWWTMRRTAHSSAAELVTLLERKHVALNAWLQTLPAEALDRGGVVVGAGRMTLRELLLHGGDHVREHAAEISAALAK